MARAGHSAASGRALHETGAVQETVSDEQKDDLAALRTAALTTEAAVLKLAGTDTGDPGFGKATDKTKRLTDQVTRAGDALERLATGTGDDLAVARIRAATVGNLPERARRTTLLEGNRAIDTRATALRGQGLDQGLVEQILEPDHHRLQAAAAAAAEAVRLNQQAVGADAALRRPRRTATGSAREANTLAREIARAEAVLEDLRLSAARRGDPEAAARARTTARAARQAENGAGRPGRTHRPQPGRTGRSQRRARSPGRTTG